MGAYSGSEITYSGNCLCRTGSLSTEWNFVCAGVKLLARSTEKCVGIRGQPVILRCWHQPFATPLGNRKNVTPVTLGRNWTPSRRHFARLCEARWDFPLEVSAGRNSLHFPCPQNCHVLCSPGWVSFGSILPVQGTTPELVAGPF